jgi:hypothetical protein
MKTGNFNTLLAALVASTATLIGCVDDGAALPEEGAAPADPQLVEKRHCVTEVVAQREGDPAPLAAVAPSQPRCFDTFAESISFATKGAVHLSSDASPETLERVHTEQAAAAGTYITSVEYLGLKWDAYWGTHTFVSSVTCDQGYVLSVANLQGLWASNGWTMNDSIGSVQTFSGCVHAYHYDYANFGGALIDCPSSPAWNCYYGMGAMNDRTSSIRWTN